MAEVKREPIAKLTPEQVTSIKQIQGDIPQLRKEVEALKKIGMDMTEVENKIDWAETTGKTLLDTFS